MRESFCKVGLDAWGIITKCCCSLNPASPTRSHKDPLTKKQSDQYNMISSYQVIIFGISLASASVLRPLQLAVLPSSITLTKNISLPSTVDNIRPNLSSITYVCGGNYYGRGPLADSCDEAVRTMAIVPGSAAQEFTWGERETGIFDVPLPQRWYSCWSLRATRVKISVQLTGLSTKRTAYVTSRWSFGIDIIPLSRASQRW